MHKMKSLSVALSLFVGQLYGMSEEEESKPLTLTQQVVLNRTLVLAALEGSSSNIIGNLIFLRADVNAKTDGKPLLDLLSDKYNTAKKAEKENYVHSMAILMKYPQTDKEKLTIRFSGKMLSDCFELLQMQKQVDEWFKEAVEEQKKDKEKSSL